LKKNHKPDYGFSPYRENSYYRDKNTHELGYGPKGFGYYSKEYTSVYKIDVSAMPSATPSETSSETPNETPSETPQDAPSARDSNIRERLSATGRFVGPIIAARGVNETLNYLADNYLSR
jgi:hypothetical protein